MAGAIPSKELEAATVQRSARAEALALWAAEPELRRYWCKRFPGDTRKAVEHFLKAYLLQTKASD